MGNQGPISVENAGIDAELVFKEFDIPFGSADDAWGCWPRLVCGAVVSGSVSVSSRNSWRPSGMLNNCVAG